MQKQLKVQNSQPKSILYSNSHLTYIQLAELQKTIGDLVQQNRKKHAKIVIQKPEFSYQLYKISEFQAISKAFGKELLLRQLDRLLEEKNYLDRELSLIRFQDEEKNNEKEKMVANETNHFQLLKSIWRKDNTKKYEGTLEHIEELNLMVGQIKSNIQSLIKFQSNDSKQFEQTYINTFQVLHEKNKECQKCHEYQAKAEYLNTKIQNLQQKLSKQSDENIAYLQQINNKDDKLKKANKSLLKQQTQFKNKIIMLQQEILKKDQFIRQLKKQIVDLSSPYKFVNPNQKYELIVKADFFDISKYNKEINIPLENLLKIITNSNDISAAQVNQNTLISKQDFLRPLAQVNSAQVTSMTFSSVTSLDKVRKDSYDNSRSQNKLKGFLGDDLHMKLQQMEGSNKKYIRTSSKRVHRGSTSSQQDEGNATITNIKTTKINLV